MELHVTAKFKRDYKRSSFFSVVTEQMRTKENIVLRTPPPSAIADTSAPQRGPDAGAFRTSRMPASHSLNRVGPDARLSWPVSLNGSGPRDAGAGDQS